MNHQRKKTKVTAIPLERHSTWAAYQAAPSRACGQRGEPLENFCDKSESHFLNIFLSA
jgi:hypothetical protein